MKVIQESPEHHFLTFLDKIKDDAGGWVGLHFGLSRKLNHNDLVDNPQKIKDTLFKLREESEILVRDIAQNNKKYTNAHLYLFTDSDIILLANPQNDSERSELQNFFNEISGKIGTKICKFSSLAKDIYLYQKLADQRFISANRADAYKAITDENKVGSIAIRRQRREQPLILIVEDDRFTASYATNILNKDYELIHAKTGEEAVIFYVEHAPDLVLLDIHLPGISGHDALRAIKKADPDACVTMLSVDTAKTNIVSTSKNGATGFLKKPFSKERLLSVVKKSPYVRESERDAPQT